MKKSTIIKYLSMAACAAVIAGVMTACGESRTPNAKTTLSAPKDLYLSFERELKKTNYVLTWESVENASGYEISMDGETVGNTEETRFDLTDYLTIEKTARLGVTALGGEEFFASEESFSECTAERVGVEVLYFPSDKGNEAYCGVSKISGRLVIPDFYQGEPVTKIKDFGFGSRTGPSSSGQLRMSEITGIRFPRGLKEIGEAAFCDCSYLTELDFPDGLESIGSSAFAYCTRLKDLVFPDSITKVGEYAFEMCSGLKSVELSKHLTELSSGVFFGCEKLTSVELPRNLKVLKGFRVCEGLTEITIPSSVTELCLDGCTNLERVVFEAGNQMKNLNESAFYGCSKLKEIELPSSLKEIGKFAFSGCTLLSSINIPKGVTKIEEFAFGKCTSLSAVEIPKSVTEIMGGAFGGCTSLREIALETGNGAYKTVNGDLYTIDGKTLVQYACGKEETEFTVPAGVETVGAKAFLWSVLKKVVVPSWVKRIEANAFSDNSFLEEIILSEGLEYIGESFTSQTAIKTLKIPKSVKTIVGGMIDWQSLTYLELSEGVEAIENYAVGELASVENLIVPTSMKKFGEQIVADVMFFSGIVYNVYYLGTAKEWAKIENSDKFKPSKGLYFYSETEPTEEGNFWRYVDGVPTPWGEE